MKICHWSDVKPAAEAYATGVEMRWVIGESDGAPHFAMRVVEVAPGASTQHHVHWWEHEVFVLAGAGYLRMDDGNHRLSEGTVVFIPGNDKHQIVNDGNGVLRFICLIPHPKLEGLFEAEASGESQNLC